ncbi:hypothetical protein GCM10027277_55910 [Pseudoduganella ginsengisoli]|uniref:DUF4402 domain-containing protein n=1 Tax=Pseudoduganella ginsengisoli TaxID=1462440 RepID=A0A6L6Q5J6_9BURK|nr:hypothetical protein [Pseudoduganella ginsengisoli]MTW05027.1 hypothetical protein [Pseudoduganella ginsengisoli]
MINALLLLLMLCCCAVRAGEMKQLDDEALGQVAARDGVSIAAHIVINDPTLVGAVADSRMSLGFGGDGAQRYVVLKNVRGVVDMAGVHVDVAKKPDGTDYVAVTLPGYLKFSNLGFESLSVQSDPLAPVASTMGSVNINGTMNMQGQLRIWAH